MARKLLIPEKTRRGGKSKSYDVKFQKKCILQINIKSGDVDQNCETKFRSTAAAAAAAGPAVVAVSAARNYSTWRAQN